MTVVDASVLVPALADDGEWGPRFRERLSEEELWAPAVIDLEVVSGCRGLLRSGQVGEGRCHAALDDLASMPLRRARHGPLVARIWELRDNVSAYDAAYVALAEARGATLLTADARLARAPGIRCAVEVV